MSTQHKLTKKRSPRVNITYDLEVGEASQKKELPFVIGVIGEFSKSSTPVKERGFTTITKENFNSVMKGFNPSLNLNVENKITTEGGYLNVNLNFNEMADFTPENIARNIEPLRKLLEARGRLSDLKIRALSNETLREHLESMSEMSPASKDSPVSQPEAERNDIPEQQETEE
ncbi:type VI secretion system contractile sheath small subunit [Enterobacter ludwigii]|uniref:type VI secretion system contractile sheath small subunit n=1 Tax=Enterobacter ludwigii TaxID=299767 RepID=UPI00242C0F87|nr:type VI secretion system contractile sheath small subunit [Enterobacter ludwigii]WGA04008.1 type VI secretion system contractile sheath small subunit [Enterobacter ludwigii]